MSMILTQVSHTFDELNWYYEVYPGQESLLVTGIPLSSGQAMGLEVQLEEEIGLVRLVTLPLLKLQNRSHLEAVMQMIFWMGQKYALGGCEFLPDNGELQATIQIPLNENGLSPIQRLRWQVTSESKGLQAAMEILLDDAVFHSQKLQDRLLLLVQVVEQALLFLSSFARHTASEFLEQVFNLILRSESDSSQVYSFLYEHLDKLDLPLLSVIEGIGSILQKEQDHELKNAILESLYMFGKLIQEFPRENSPGLNQELAIQSYKALIQEYTNENSSLKLAIIRSELAFAYQHRIQGDRAGNLECAIQNYITALQLVSDGAIVKDETIAKLQAAMHYNYGLANFDLAELDIDRQTNLRQAVECYQAAVKIWRLIGLKYNLSRALNNLGNANKALAELGAEAKVNLCQAVEYYQEAVQIQKQEAVQIQKQPGLERDLSRTLSNWGVSCCSLAGLGVEPQTNLKQAIKLFEEAVQISRQLDLESELPGILSGWGNAYLDLAELGVQPQVNLLQAVERYQEAAQISQRIGLQRELSYCLNSWGITCLSLAKLGVETLNNLEQAIKLGQKAVQIRRNLDFKYALSKALNSLGNTYSELAKRVIEPKANLEQAMEAYQEAAQILRELRSERDLSTILVNMGGIYIALAKLDIEPLVNLEQAIGLFQEAAQISRDLELKRDLSWILMHRGVACTKLAELGADPQLNLEQAIKLLQEAVQISRDLGVNRELSWILNNLSVAYSSLAELGIESQKNYHLAIGCYQEALTFLQPSLFPNDCIIAANNLGNLGFVQGNWQVAIDGYSKAISAIESRRNLEKEEELRQQVIQDAIDIYERMVQACVNAGQLDLALQTVERSRSKRLHDLIQIHDVYKNGEIPAEIKAILDGIEAEHQQLDQLRALLERNSGNGGTLSVQMQPASETDLIAAIQAGQARIQALQSQLFRQDEVTAQISAEAWVDLQTIQQQLSDSPRTALLSFYTTREDTLIFVVHHNRIECFTCTGQGLAILQQHLGEQWVLPYANSRSEWETQMPDRLRTIAQRLELDRLIATHLQDIQELILIPHLFLHLIPFAALPLNTSLNTDSSGETEYLGDRFVLRYAPSCQVLKFCHDRHPLSGPGRHGIIENATNDVSPVSIAGEKMAALFPEPEPMRLQGREQATKTAYRTMLEHVQTVFSIHHATSKLDNPINSALILGDTPITLGQLLSPAWRFPELGEVFLSCCETGVGVPQSLADEVLTIGTGFLVAGARSVISSLWTIYVISTVMFCWFYQEHRYRGDDRASAIQQAQQNLRNLSKAQLQTLWEHEIEPFLTERQNRLETQRIQARSQSRQYAKDSEEFMFWQQESQRYGEQLDNLIDAGEKAKKQLDQFLQTDYPFRHPIHWAAFICQGLR